MDLIGILKDSDSIYLNLHFSGHTDTIITDVCCDGISLSIASSRY